MKLLPFICGSSLLLAGWLLVTFIHEVPSQRYLNLEGQASRAPADSTATAEHELPHVAEASRETPALSF
ncbi:MAG: hypothetical protein ACQCXQ_07680 [Verrucomicrobiales bacterium]|nr:hypothetical protein [Verrucomicrobiota bacterium JB025]